MLLADRRGGTQMIAYVVLVAGVAIAALPAARGLDASAKGTFEQSTIRFDKPGTYVGGDTGARGGGGGALAFGGDTSRGWTLEQVADAVLPNPPAGSGAVVCDPSQIGRAPSSAPDPARPRYALGGSRDGFGHTWAAVELPDGRVARFDYRARGFEGGSSDNVRALWTDGDARVSYVGSWAELAAGGDEVYTFDTTPEGAAEVLRRMRADETAPPDYSLIFQNCTDRAFGALAGADPSWAEDASVTVRPQAALDRARERAQARCSGTPASAEDGLLARRAKLRAIDEGRFDPEDWTRLGAYEATRGYPPGTVGYAVHRAIGLIYVTMGTFGEERIGEVFHSAEARQHYPHPVDGPHSRAMADLEYAYWARVYAENPDSWGGWMGTRFPGGVRDWIQWGLGGSP